MKELLKHLPLSYTFFTRLRGGKPLLVFLYLEIIPFVIILGKPFSTIFACLCFLGLYEIGYFYNDKSASANETDRKSFSVTNPVVFIVPRLIIYFCFFCFTRSHAFLFFSLLVMTTFLIHNHFSMRKNGLRLVTFSLLSLTKYLPVLVLFQTSQWIKSFIYLGVGYSLPRIMHYSTSKKIFVFNQELIDFVQIILLFTLLTFASLRDTDTRLILFLLLYFLPRFVYKYFFKL
jgi:hypothetical protein